MLLGHPLFKVRDGRFLIRGAAKVSSRFDSPANRTGFDYGEAKLILGVIALPKRADLERLHLARINASLWVDIAESKRTEGHHYPVQEESMASLLKAISHRRHLLPDSLDLFVRETMLAHEDPGLRWVFIGGVAPQALDACPSDGIWEVQANGDNLAKVSSNTFNGEAMGALFRFPVWGPEGKWGFATDLVPKTYRAWVDGNREENKKRDPDFAAFIDAMEAAMPLQMVYDAETHERRERLSKQVLRQVLEARDALPGVLDSKNESASSAPRMVCK